MLRIPVALTAALALLPMTFGQASVWAQCGGQGFSGPTKCVAGAVCFYNNPFYSSCFPVGIMFTALKTAASTQGSNTVAKSLGSKLYFGTVTDNYQLNDPIYASTLNNISLFGQITPKSLRWDATEAVQGFFTFTDADAMGHSCVSYDEIPSWVVAGNFNPTQYHNILVNHCATVVPPFNDDGSLREFVFVDGLGTSYFDIALNTARGADPAAKLYISDTNMDTPGPKADSMISQVQYLQDHGTPIDGVGFKSHFITGQLPSKEGLIANYERFTALGIEIAITELDIRLSVSAAGLVQQQRDYQTVISACKAVAGCVGVTLSEIADRLNSLWRARVSPGTPYVPSAVPLVTQLTRLLQNVIPKLAYDGIIAGWTN
ncbi:endo-1,4-beta-xylanase C precursor [Mycena leptocephala]|nr:endo-1,4-beta-xylanase C precursor [Mycena leptocephala]